MSGEGWGNVGRKSLRENTKGGYEEGNAGRGRSTILILDYTDHCRSANAIVSLQKECVSESMWHSLR